VKPERFAQLLASYGGRLERWPAAEREAAKRFLAGDAEAARQQSVALEFDELLDAYVLAGPDADLIRRVNLGFRPRASHSLLREWWLGLALGSAAAAGAACGVLLPVALPQDDSSALNWADDQATAFGAYEWEEWQP